MTEVDQCPPSAAFFGFMGIAAAVVFSNLGAAYGTAKAGVGLASMGVMRPQLAMRNIVAVVMAGILGIYGLILAAILTGRVTAPTSDGATYSSFSGYAHLAAGLVLGLSCLAAGLAIGIAGDAGVRAIGQQEDLFVTVLLILIFGEALALYGLISSLLLSSKVVEGVC